MNMTPPIQSDTYSADDTLDKVIELHRVAAVTGDTELLDAILADGFIHTNSLGELRAKETHLQRYRDKQIDIESILFEKSKVTYHGDGLAVVNIRAQAKESYNGEDRSGTYQLSRVYYKTPQGWKCIMNHGHPVSIG
jgi:hypothetical protein